MAKEINETSDESRIFIILKNLALLRSKYCFQTPESEKCFERISEALEDLVKQIEKTPSNKKRDPVKEVHRGIQFMNDVLWGPEKRE
jgi:hypothetical protein